MARGKNKKQSAIKISLKYELIGILILIFSVIALSQQGRVARSLTYLFRFLIGEMDWVFPVVFIYIGLFVMMKRAWPTTWNRWKSGVLLIFIGFLVQNHMTMIHLLDPLADYTAPSYIINTTWESMMSGLQVTGDQSEILKQYVGGGMIGAVLYAVLYFLFGNLGSKLLVFTLFVIAFLLITGLSIVDLGGKFRPRSDGLQGGIKLWCQNLFTTWSKPNKKKSAIKMEKPSLYLPDEDDLEEENEYVSVVKQKKKPSFFQFLQSSKTKSADVSAEDELDEITPLCKLPLTPQSSMPHSTKDEEDPRPFIRDFQDHMEPLNEVSGVISKPGQKPTHKQTVTFEAEEQAEEQVGSHAEVPEVHVEVKQPDRPYQLPPLQILAKLPLGKSGESLDYKANARKLELTLESFGVRAKVLEVVRGPSVTRYEIQPDVGVKVSRIVSLTDDIALALAAKDIRMEAPIPGKAAIGIEVPNLEVSIVTLREVMESSAFRDSTAKLSISLGRDISGQPIVGNLARMPHLLVAGATGSGKSVCINGIITSILFKAKPNEVKFLMIDPKMVELNVYNGIPHLLAPVVTDPRRASLALKKVVVEMEKRYELFSKSGARNIEGYNTLISDPKNPNPLPPLPLIVVIVDELADLMMVAANDVEDAICRLAQMARAAGIHLIIATQRPSVDVITGTIKANIPSRIAFGVSSNVDSRTILDMAGAEKLLGRGDMLYLPVGASKPVRIQGAFLSDHEVESVVNFVRNQEKAIYREELVPEIEEQADPDVFVDELYDQAVQIVLEAKQASVSLLQRRMRVGYTRAARLIDAMEAKGVVGPYEGSKPREVLLTL